MESLLDKLQQYASEDYYPMHMPGHKRNCMIMHPFNPVEVDITEIDGFDNLHHAEGILKCLMDRVQSLYQSDKSYLLINGSTVGLLAGISACVKKGDKVIVARNCHKAVYNAILLNELEPVYVYPPLDGIYGINGGILPKNIEELLITHPDVKLVIVTSPTYEGIVSDVAAISKIAHEHGIPVLVDEAHGAHLGFSSEFPGNSISSGADVVIHSIHKTLPAFTQTALMHVNGPRVEHRRVERALGIYETSSPSYILMSGIDQCMKILETRADELFFQHSCMLAEFWEKVKALKYLRILKKEDYQPGENGIFDVDPSKIVISVKNTNMTGRQLLETLLERYKIQLEMSSLDYALAMTSICDTREGYERLAQALIEIDDNLEADLAKVDLQDRTQEMDLDRCDLPIAIQRIKPSKAMECEIQDVALEEAEGRVCAAYICAYPPGTPVIVPGEQIGAEQLAYLKAAMECGLEILGLSKEDSCIAVVWEHNS